MAEDFGYTLRKLRHIHYGGLSFHVVCPTCGEPVEPDKSIGVDDNGDYIKENNATCARHGRVQMPYDGKFTPKPAP